MTAGVAAAYSATGAAWERGPARIYDRLAEVVVSALPVPLDGVAALDLGAGTGAATRALLAAGAARVVAVDAAVGMLAHDAGRRPPAVAGDALALPFAAGAFDATVAAFALNHLADPAAGLREAARVTRPGGGLAASAYAYDDDHPVKYAVQAALAARGWTPEPWYRALQVDAAPRLATVAAARAAAEAAGIDAEVEPARVPFPDLDAPALIAWRLGLAQHAPFVAALPTDADRAALA
ncbi:MAG TPA: methyltransferase domain-containing protein, partial [Acidimicrobiia bacterium]|nr:methyltransferase domain-containing protein [Acidimicrobiia bacterium]